MFREVIGFSWKYPQRRFILWAVPEIIFCIVFYILPLLTETIYMTLVCGRGLKHLRRVIFQPLQVHPFSFIQFIWWVLNAVCLALIGYIFYCSWYTSGLKSPTNVKLFNKNILSWYFDCTILRFPKQIFCRRILGIVFLDLITVIQCLRLNIINCL